MFSTTDVVGAACGGAALGAVFRWLFERLADAPALTVHAFVGGMTGSWWERCIDVLLNATWPPAVLAASGIAMATIGIVQFIRKG